MENLFKRFKTKNGKSEYAKLYTEEYIDEVDFNKAELKIKSLNIVGGDREKILLANGEPVFKESITVNEANHLARGADIIEVGTADNCVPDLKWVNGKIDNLSKTFTTNKLIVNGDIIQNGESYITHSENLEIENNMIITRSVKDAPKDIKPKPLGDKELTGIKALYYKDNPLVEGEGFNGILAFDKNGVARVGDEGFNSDGSFMAQAIATREEHPLDKRILFWNNNELRIDTKYPDEGIISGNINIQSNVSKENNFLSNNPNILFSEKNDAGTILNPLKIVYVNDQEYKKGIGLKITGDDSNKEYWLEASKVYGAVWNDLVDKVIVPNNTILEYGKCYYTDGKNYKKTNKYCQRGILGIHSDTFGFSMGEVKNQAQLNIAVAGFVLAFTDKKYKSGTPLTCTKNGYLTKISLWDKIIYPERIVGTYWKDETQNEWNGIKVNNRNWIKIK